MSIWRVLGAIALIVAAYAFGRSDGGAIERDKNAAVNAAVLLERGSREDKVDQVGGGQAQAERKRSEQVRNIYVEVPKLIGRPVYGNVCVDADGVQLIDRAAAAANGEDPGVGSAGTGEGAEGKPLP